MQTLQPYTPAHGVNVDVAAGEAGRQLKVRNLLVVSDAEGQGIPSASIVSRSPTAWSRSRATPAGPTTQSAPSLTVTGSPVDLKPNQIVVLTEGDAYTVTSPDLKPGLLVDLTLTFESGAQASAQAPVMSYEDPIYSSFSPSPVASPTATVAAPGATPAPSATPDALTPGVSLSWCSPRRTAC